VKKKLKALDVRIQIALVAVGLILVAVLGYMFVVSPQNAQATKLQGQVSAEQSLIEQRRQLLKAGLHPPVIQTADIFRLSRAMPDREDMPGIILTLSQVASAAGITFDLIEPTAGATGAPLNDNFTTERVHLQFKGDFYGLSDFLYRLRSLVAVRDGKLIATGRLFNVDSVAMSVQHFPSILADVYVDAYVYHGSASTTATPAAPTTTTSSSSTSTSLPTDASAAGATTP
jgi:Tfp pilus assembly protein PilO